MTVNGRQSSCLSNLLPYTSIRMPMPLQTILVPSGRAGLDTIQSDASNQILRNKWPLGYLEWMCPQRKFLDFHCVLDVMSEIPSD